MAGPGSQARGFHSGGRLGRSAKSSSTKGSGPNGRPMTLDILGRPQELAPNTPNPFTQKEGTPLHGKPTSSGNKPGEDTQAVTQTKIKTGPLTDVEKAILEATRQRALQSDGLDAAQTVMGLMPAPGLSTAFGLGRWMGRKTEEDAMAHPENYKTNLADPGSLYSKSGPVSTNRAVVGPSAKSSTASADATGETLKKKKQALPTLLGAPAQPLGTFSNPVQIT